MTEDGSRTISVVCGATIIGPRVGRRVVAWQDKGTDAPPGAQDEGART